MSWSSFSQNTHAMMSGEFCGEQWGKSFIICKISSHKGLVVIIRKMSGCPMNRQTTRASWKFCYMYLREPTKPAGRMKPLPTLLVSEVPLLTESLILLYNSVRKVVWWVRSHHNLACSIVEKASTTYCWYSLPPSRGVIPELEEYIRSYLTNLMFHTDPFLFLS